MTFRDPEEAREAVKDGIAYLIEEDGYTPQDIRENLVEPALEEYEEGTGA